MLPGIAFVNVTFIKLAALACACFHYRSYLFANRWLQFSFDLAPVDLLQAALLSDNQHRASLRLGVTGRNLKLQHHVRHFCDNATEKAN